MRIGTASLIILIICIIDICLSHKQQPTVNSLSDDPGMFYSTTKTTLEELLQKDSELKKSEYLKKYYNSSNTRYDKEVDKAKKITEAYEYLITYSSRSKNDLSTFYECEKTKQSNINKYNYFVIQFDSGQKEVFYPNTLTLGLCLVFDENVSEYTNTIKDIITKTNAGSGYVFIPKGTEFSIINVNEFQNSSNEWYEVLTLSICLVIYIILALFNVFNIIPEYLFKCCFKKHRNNEHAEIEKKDLNKNQLFRFVSCFNITENSEEFFDNTLSTVIYNDTGLSYSKGVTSICLIVFLYGLTYMRLFQSSTLLFQENQYKSTLRNALFPLFSFGVKFCPRVLFSVSGFTFIYKIVCFFEDESARNQEEKEVKEELKNSIHASNNFFKQDDKKDIKLNQSLDTLIHKGILLDKKEHNLSQIDVISLFIFIFGQFHKFINALLAILLFRTISILMKQLSIFCSSLAIVYKEIFGKVDFTDIFGHFFLYKTFYLFEGNIIGEKHDHCCMRFIWIFINEVFFFLVSAPIIFICCKFKISLNKVILTLLSLFLVFRYLIYYLMLQSQFNYSNNLEKATNILYDLSSYNSFAMNPLYNYPDFLIGIFFGLMNYVLQKDINTNNHQGSIFGLSSTIVYYLKYQTKILLYFFVVLFIVCVCIIVVIQQIFYLAVKNNDHDFYSNEGINAFYLIDIEIVIILIHLLLFALYAKGGNSLTELLSSNSWVKFNKIYFSVITTINMYLLLIIHQSETMISLEIFSFLFYGSITFVVMLLFAYINCIFNEFPLKKLIKLIIAECKNSKNKSSIYH